MSSIYTNFAIVASLTLGSLSLDSAASATIIDIDAYDPDSAVILDLGRGDYVIDTVGREGGGLHDAWNAWGDNRDCDDDGMNCAQGWLTGYAIESDLLGFTMIDYEPVFNGAMYTTPQMALANAMSYRFWLASAESVMFSIFDPNKSDNLGGISLRIRQVPEPTGLALIASGMFGLALLMRNRKRRRVLSV